MDQIAAIIGEFTLVSFVLHCADIVAMPRCN